MNRIVVHRTLVVAVALAMMTLALAQQFAPAEAAGNQTIPISGGVNTYLPLVSASGN